MYSVSTRRIIETQKQSTDSVKQVWFADDSAGAGDLDNIKIWWESLKVNGQAYGYFAKPSKTCLIVKDAQLVDRANDLFGTDGLTVTVVEEERHIRAVIGSEDFKKSLCRRGEGAKVVK